MHDWLIGVETEYGITVDGHDPTDQVNDAVDFVRSYRDGGLRGWNYKYESPRSDLRGFVLDRLQVDPVDARFDRPETVSDSDVRSDWLLPNGGRFYNDHGHPELSTPECWSCLEAALQDKAGERLLLDTAESYSEQFGRKATLYKNNTDYHGASYGTHESYLVPREIGYERLYAFVAPILVARTLLCGAGKVGSESGTAVDYQLSQRADFLVESVNTETLYRRPVFNTRDEPHAESALWMRLHVISGDANRMVGVTARKLALVRVAIELANQNHPPLLQIENLSKAINQISRHPDAPVSTDRGMMSADEILTVFIEAAREHLDLDEESQQILTECERLMVLRHESFADFSMQVDWAAKRLMLEDFIESEGMCWTDPRIRAFDLEYHNIDPQESLFDTLVELGRIIDQPLSSEVEKRLESPQETNRAYARSVAISKFQDHFVSACWKSITFEVDGQAFEVDLDPVRRYSSGLAEIADVESFIESLRKP